MRTGRPAPSAKKRRPHWPPTIVIVAAGALLLLLWPAQAFSAGAVSFDLQSAINACPAGGTVNIPAGTITVSSTVNLKSGVTLQGAGVDATILSMPVQSTDTGLLVGKDVSNLAVRDLTLTSPAASGYVYALWFSRYSGVTLERVKVTNCMYALKADTQGANLTVRDFTVRGCGMNYISNLTGGLFERWDVEVLTQQVTSSTSHAIYLEGNNHHLQFNTVRARGGSGWTVQLYQESQDSDDIAFNGLDVTGWPVIIGQGFSNVSITNMTAVGQSGTAVVGFYGGSGVTIDGFTASGGDSLTAWEYDQPTGVTFRNGTYAGQTLGSIPGAVWDNVSAGATGATTTTVAPTTTTTTVAPTTTTTATVVPTTTTTQARPTTTTTTTATVVPTTTTTQARPTTTTTTQARPTTTTTAPSTTTTASTVPIWALITTTQRPKTTTTTVAQTTTSVNPTTTTTMAPTTTTTVAPMTSPLTPSALSFTSPAVNSFVSGRVDVRLQVSSTTLSKVRLYVDDRLLATDYRGPFTFTWDTKWVASGSSHALTAVGYDQNGRTIGQAGISVIVVDSVRAASASALSSLDPASAFADMSTISPYNGAVLSLAEAGVISGFDDGTFGAAKPTTRAQVAKMVSGILGIADSDVTTTPFTDLDSMDAGLYPQKYVAALLSVESIQGTGPGRFSPYESVTRAQLVTMMVRALHTLDPEALTEPPAGFASAVGSFSSAYDEPMRVADYNGLLAGLEGYGRTWDPWASATRGEVAQMLRDLTQLD